MQSLNTIVLKIVSVLERTNDDFHFTDGDLVIKPSPELLDATYGQASYDVQRNDGWYILPLSVPLPSGQARVHIRPHTRRAEYLVIRVPPVVSAVDGMARYLVSMLLDDEVKAICKKKPSCLSNRETIESACGEATSALAQLRAYDSTARIGNEFFAPHEIYENESHVY